jgi:hypothetical protein
LHESGMQHGQDYCVFLLADVAETVRGA